METPQFLKLGSGRYSSVQCERTITVHSNGDIQVCVGKSYTNESPTITKRMVDATDWIKINTTDIPLGHLSDDKYVHNSGLTVIKTGTRCIDSLGSGLPINMSSTGWQLLTNT